MEEPVDRVRRAVAEAEGLTGDQRDRRILQGLLESLEFHNGIAVTASNHIESIPETFRTSIAEFESSLFRSLADRVAIDERELRMTMAVGAVHAAVRSISKSSSNGAEFVHRLQHQRDGIIEVVLDILR